MQFSEDRFQAELGWN